MPFMTWDGVKFSERLCKAMEDAGRSAADVCRESGVSEATLSRWRNTAEARSLSCRVDSIVAVAQCLNRTPAYLVFGSDGTVTDAERDLLSEYARLSGEHQQAVRTVISGLLGASVSEPSSAYQPQPASTEQGEDRPVSPVQLAEDMEQLGGKLIQHTVQHLEDPDVALLCKRALEVLAPLSLALKRASTHGQTGTADTDEGFVAVSGVSASQSKDQAGSLSPPRTPKTPTVK